MKLFKQLTDAAQKKVLNYCMNTVVKDILEVGLDFEPQSDRDFELKYVMEEEIEKVKNIKSITKKTLTLMKNEVVYESVFAIALEMAKTAYYHSEDELVIFPASLDENIIHLLQEDLSDPDASGQEDEVNSTQLNTIKSESKKQILN